MRFDWRIAMFGKVQLKFEWLPEHQCECRFHLYQKRDVEGLVMRCGTATGRLGLSLIHEATEAQSKITPPLRRTTTTEKRKKFEHAKTECKGVVSLTFERRRTSSHRQIG